MKSLVKSSFFFVLVLGLSNIFLIGAAGQGYKDVEANADYNKRITEFEIWAITHGIELVGINKGTNHLYYNGFNPQEDIIDWKTVPGVLDAAESLYMIPESVIEVMRGKTIYFSNQQGRSYTVLSPFPDYNILSGVNRGIILEQKIVPYTVLHEIGHIVDYHGIQGLYDDNYNIFSESKDARFQVFAVNATYNPNSKVIPPGHITIYSVANEAENFAENFAYFVMYYEEYQQRVKSDPLLVDEYEFLKRYIFKQN